MATLDSVQTPGVSVEVDPTFRAERVSLRPYDHNLGNQLLGHYRVAGTTTAAAPAANSVLFTFRWGDPSRFCVINRVSAFISTITAVTPQATPPMVLTVQRAYTANETTNVTALTPTANTGKSRINQGSSLVSQIAVASAAAGISGGTKTADAQPASMLPVLNLAAIGSGQAMDDFIRNDQLGMHPLTLSANEGFSVAWGGTALATGTVQVSIIVAWSELALF